MDKITATTVTNLADASCSKKKIFADASAQENNHVGTVTNLA
jgi:hypothetical protein